MVKYWEEQNSYISGGIQWLAAAAVVEEMYLIDYAQVWMRSRSLFDVNDKAKNWNLDS